MIARLFRIRWAGFGSDTFARFPQSTLHWARPAGAVLCGDPMCHRCRVLERTWKWAS